MLDAYGHKYTRASSVMLFAFPLQQLLHERVSMLRYTTLPAWFSLETAVDLKFMGTETERARNVRPHLGFMSGRVNLKTVQHVNSRNTYVLCSAW